MIKLRLSLLEVLITVFPIILIGQQNENWITDSQKKEANFFEIKEKYRQKFTEQEKNKSIRIQSKSNSIKIVGENDFMKFRRWEWFMSQNIHSDGTMPSSKEIYDSFEKVSEMNNKPQLKNTTAATWKNISRTSNSGGYWGMGRTLGIGFHPTNKDIFWVCAESGGI